MFVSTLLLMACTDYTLEKRPEGEGAGPAIEATPNPMLFGELPVASRAEQTLRIQNVGAGALNLTALTVSEGDAWFQVTVPEGVLGTYEPEMGTLVLVTYVSDGNPVSGKLSILSNDASSPTTIVDLVGGAAVPDLVIEPDSVSFGAVTVGERGEQSVSLRNVGDADLVVTGMSTTEVVFDYSTAETLPFTIPAGESRSVTLGYVPVESATSTGLFEVVSNDPDGVESATLSGSAGGQPVAVCSVTPDTVEAIHGSADWIGNASYDPSGYAITDYNWTFTSVPAGSSSFMPSGGANRRGFVPDVVGTYEARLVVTNSLGERSEPCFASLEAEAVGGLWIEMFWTRSGDDMDLHLVRPVSGSPSSALTTTNDCYYGNCVGGWSGLDWGRVGDSSDDPALDLDDIPGTGPENINILSPESGTFTVYVHDYPGSVYSGTNMVTVNIYVGGRLAWTDTRDVNSEDYYAPFAEVEWPRGTVTSL